MFIRKINKTINLFPPPHQFNIYFKSSNFVRLLCEIFKWTIYRREFSGFSVIIWFLLTSTCYRCLKSSIPWKRSRKSIIIYIKIRIRFIFLIEKNGLLPSYTDFYQMQWMRGSGNVVLQPFFQNFLENSW